MYFPFLMFFSLYVTLYLVSWYVSQCDWAAIAKYDTLSGLNNINLFPYSFGDWKSKIKVAAGS